MDINFKMGQTIKQIRISKGYSQQELCRDICHVNTLVKIESNTLSPSFEILRALAARMGLTVDDLIKRTELERDPFYVQIRTRLKKSVAKYDVGGMEQELSLLSDEMYEKLPPMEQQFIDVLKLALLLDTYKDFEAGYKLAKESLYKTYKDGATFFTDEECMLINNLLKIEQSEEHIALAKEAFEWVRKQDDSVQNGHCYILLLNGLTMTAFLQENWLELTEYAAIGEQVATKYDKARFMPIFIFMLGISDYMLAVNKERGLGEMKRALDYSLVMKNMFLYQALISYTKKYNIELK
ncbi:helix-turn-helix domain-containing protein [Culicoidibacter larvae]|uniref:Helix-turn-helix transcriptional regulator n=1 Tax=Culicoidibacter larvae TaxID=2579976 RepID=A0A5R8QHA2_9FIRM|nr:helix-turn-helix transcriptional regulator [Culicoidibacter larvae]TLG76647.1 helix-turn-helix transcriptional regulator [Culicoidibacter larvae]